MISLYRKSYITEKNRRPPERQSKAKSKGDVEGSIDQRFDKLTDPKQPRIPERQSKGPLIDGSTSSPILTNPGPLSSVEGSIDRRFDELTDPY